MPPSHPRESTDDLPGRSRRATTLAATLLGCLVLLFLRKPEALTTPQFWAEDGTQFFEAARDDGAGSLLAPYNGYRHVLPRVIALAATALPPGHAPAIFNASAALTMLLAAAFCFDRRLNLPSWSAAAFALSFVLVPHSGVVFANLTNVLNVLVIPLVLLTLAAAPRTARERLLDFGVLLAAGSSGPWIAVVTPFFVLRVVRQRDPWSAMLLSSAIVLSVIQTSTLAGARTPGELDIANPAWPAAVAMRGVGALLLGWAEPLELDVGVAAHASIYAVGSVVLYAFVLMGGWLVRRSTAVVLGAASLTFQGLVAWAYRGNPFYLFTESLDRYSYPALVTFIWALIVLAGRELPAAVRWPARLILTGILASTLGGFTADSQPDMRWKQAWETSIAEIPERIAITPPGWFVSRQPRSIDRSAAITALGETMGRDILEVRPEDVVPIRAWTGREWLTGLPSGSGCVFDIPLGVKEVEFEVRMLGNATGPEAWTHLVVALADDPVEPEVLHAERIDLTQSGRSEAERRLVRFPANRTTTRVGVGVNGGVGGGGWTFVWQIHALR